LEHERVGRTRDVVPGDAGGDEAFDDVVDDAPEHRSRVRRRAKVELRCATREARSNLKPRQVRCRRCRTAPMDPINVLRKAVDQTGRIVAGVKPNQLAGSTPCAEWDTRALLNHTIAAVEMFDNAAQTKPFNPSIFADDNVGDDPSASYERRATALRGTLAQPNVVDR